MATKKDLVEAYAFSRRRLVTAFVSGAPGGREVEPTRPGRSIVGGVALAVLLLAGAAVLGILKSPTPVDWDQPGLITEKETGAHYVILTEGGALRPVANITSALLLLGPELTPTAVKHEDISKQSKDAAVGILGAPETPPSTSDLVETGWTACTGRDYRGDPYGVRLEVSDEDTTTPDPDAGFVVRTDGKLYLIAEADGGPGRDAPRAYSYEIPQQDPDRILQPVAGTGETNALKVTHDFLTLFPAGGALSLSSFGIPADRLGDRPADGVGLPKQAKIGDWVEVDDQHYLVTPDGAVALDEFAFAVYRGLVLPKGFTAHGRPASAAPSGRILTVADLPGTDWPTQPVSGSVNGEYCAVLDTAPGRSPGVRLATTFSGPASAVDVPGGRTVPNVEPGLGAVVMAGDWDERGSATPMMLDDGGRMYALIGDARDRLGYADVPDVVVPDSWVQLFTPGVDLSFDAARCPPTSSAPGAGEERSCAAVG